MRRLKIAVLAAVLFGTAGCPRHALPERITGAGSTFVDPLMTRWIAEYRRTCETEEEIAYKGFGSAGGIIWLTERKADFGCTDGPMTDEQLAKARKTGGEVVHVPLVLGAVVPIYNLPAVQQPIRFTGPVLADIYLGKLKKWNAPALVELNPGANLPDQEIVVVHRRDGSGTTYIWTDYLSKASPTWKKKVGVTQVPEWPTGVEQTGNDEVAKHVKNTAGSIGYVELAFAFQYDLPIGLVQNREKQFVKATLESITAAAHGALTDTPDDLRYSLTDAPGKASYPISGTTWAVLFVDQPAGRGQKVVDFLRWVIADGQAEAPKLLYAPLPPSLVARAGKQLDRVKTGN